MGNQIPNLFCGTVPGEIHLRAAGLFVVQAFSVVIFPAAPSAGQGMGAPTDAVLLLEKVCLFLIRMGLLKKGKDAPFPASHAAAAGQGSVDLVLCNELGNAGDFRPLRRKGNAGTGQVLQAVPNLPGLVIMEPQQIPVLLISRPKGSVFLRKGLAESRVGQLLGEPCEFFRETAPRIVGKAGQIPGFSGFFAEIVV